MSISYPRVPPHSIEAEQSVIGGILLENAAYPKVAGLVNDSDFYRDDHQLIYRALVDMAADNKPIDVVTVSEWMKGRIMKMGQQQRSFLEIIGGLAYLGDLAKDTPSSANIVSYAHIVHHYSLKRQVIHLTTHLQDQAFQQGSDDAALTQLLNQGAAGFFSLEQQKQAANKGFIPMKKALDDQLDVLSSLKENDGTQLLGAASSLTELDQQLSGFEKGKVYVIAGRPAMGKTTLGLNLVEGIATDTKGVVAVFSFSGDIRALAKDFNCPVILLSQLSRASESRPNKRPIISDLRESGALEQDASCVIFIYRDEVYRPNTKDKGIAELIIAKHRGGKTGTVRCAFIGENQRFANQKNTKQKGA